MSLLSDQQVLTPEFLSGLELLNGQDESKVSQIFSRIIEFEIEIRSNPERNKTSAFTSSEKLKLRSVLNEIQSQEQLELILDGLTTVLSESLYFVAKPNLLHSRLLKLNLREDLAIALASTWSSYAQALVSAERKRSVLISGPTRLRTVDYSINANVNEPTAIFKFGLTSDDTSDVTNSDDITTSNNFHVEMNPDELFKFYQQLETIQVKLDALK